MWTSVLPTWKECRERRASDVDHHDIQLITTGIRGSATNSLGHVDGPDSLKCWSCVCIECTTIRYLWAMGDVATLTCRLTWSGLPSDLS